MNTWHPFYSQIPMCMKTASFMLFEAYHTGNGTTFTTTYPAQNLIKSPLRETRVRERWKRDAQGMWVGIGVVLREAR